MLVHGKGSRHQSEAGGSCVLSLHYSVYSTAGLQVPLKQELKLFFLSGNSFRLRARNSSLDSCCSLISCPSALKSLIQRLFLFIHKASNNVGICICLTTCSFQLIPGFLGVQMVDFSPGFLNNLSLPPFALPEPQLGAQHLRPKQRTEAGT